MQAGIAIANKKAEDEAAKEELRAKAAAAPATPAPQQQAGTTAARAGLVLELCLAFSSLYLWMPLLGIVREPSIWVKLYYCTAFAKELPDLAR